MSTTKNKVSHQIDLQNLCQFEQIAEHDLCQWCQQILQYIYPTPVGVALTLVSPQEIQKLNKNYRNKNKATNVLSFPQHLPEELEKEQGYRFIGDIVICADIVAQEAEQQNKPLQEHWRHMLTHGLLHLAGYDHIDQTQAEQMEQLEIDILSTMNVSNPYIARD